MSDENQGGAAPAPEALEGVEPVESAEEGLEAADETPAAVAEEKKIQELKRKYKLKVDGEESEEELDFNDEAAIVKKLQLAKVAQKRMQEYSNLQTEIAEFLQELKTNPRKLLESDIVGLNAKEFAAKVLEEELERAAKSPEQLKIEELERKLQEREAKEKQEREQLDRQRMSELEEREATRYDEMFSKALTNSDLPHSPYTVSTLAKLMSMALDEGVEVTAEELVPIVRSRMKADMQNMFGRMPEEVLEEFIGNENFERVRKKKLAKAKAVKTTVPSPVKDVGSAPAPKETSTEKKSYRQFFGF